MYSYGPPHIAEQKQDDQLKHTYSSYVRIRDVVLKTFQRRWTIGKSGERGSGISVFAARHDDDSVTDFESLFTWQIERGSFSKHWNLPNLFETYSWKQWEDGLHPKKIMLSMWWDIQGIAHYELTISKQLTTYLHCNQLCQLKNVPP